jgi:hypothetical protein
MSAKFVVESLIEESESPSSLPDHWAKTPGQEPTCRYHFNIGEGDYRSGIAFDILACSRNEAVVLANQFLQSFFYRDPGRGGSLDLLPAGGEIAGAESLRVYVDDDLIVTLDDIVTEDLLEGTHTNCKTY